MQALAQASKTTTKTRRRNLPPAAGAQVDKSVIVKFRHAAAAAAAAVLSILTFAGLVAGSPSSSLFAPPAGLGLPFEELAPDSFSHTTFSLGDADTPTPGSRLEDSTEIGKTLAATPGLVSPLLGGTASQPARRQESFASDPASGLQVAASAPMKKPGLASSAPDDSFHVEFGDHAEPSELLGRHYHAEANQTLAVTSAAAAAANDLLKMATNNGDSAAAAAVDAANRTASAELHNFGAAASAAVDASNQTYQQVGAGRQSSSSSSRSTEEKQHELIKQFRSKAQAAAGGRARSGQEKKATARRKKGKKYAQQQLQLQLQTAQQNATLTSPPPQHQMVTYVSHQPLATSYDERLLGASQPARFLQPSAFRLALNSPALYRQLQLGQGVGGGELPPVEFNKYYLHTATGQVMAQQQQQQHSTGPQGPFELEQLQATASAPNHQKAARQQEPLQTHESGHLRTASSELVATPTSGRSPAISDHDLSDPDDEQDQDSPGGAPNSLDYESDESTRGEFVSSEHAHFGDGEGAHHQGLSPSVTKSHEIDVISSVVKQQRLVGGANDEPVAAPAHQENAENSNSGNKTTTPEVRPMTSQSKSSAVVAAAQSRPLASETQNVARQQQQQQQPGAQLNIANNELLVGPFKSEAEAPATITLAGVVYQKSGSSSALLRATPTSGGGHKSPGSEPQQVRAERAGSSAQGSANWPTSLVARPQQVASVYLGTLASPAGGITSHHESQAGGEQMSLSSSAAKPTTSVIKSLASQLGGGGGSELVIATGGNAAALLSQQQQQPTELAQLLTAGYSAPAPQQLYQQRLPNGSLIWTLSKPAGLIQAAASSDSSYASEHHHQHLFHENSHHETGESKHHEHKSGGPIVIVQKDVKPVKYHLLRAYLKLRRLLRPFEATYVFPGDQVAGASSNAYSSVVSGPSSVSASGGGAFLRRRQQNAPHLPAATAAARPTAARWLSRRAKFLSRQQLPAASAAGRLE